MSITEKAKEEIGKYLAIGLLALLLLALTGVWLLPETLLPFQVIELLDKYSTGKVLLRALLLIGGLSAWIVYLRPCLIFNGRLGIYRDLKSGLYYCTKCKTNRKLTPLQVRDVGWYCSVHHWLYNNPDYTPPEVDPPQYKPECVDGQIANHDSIRRI